MKGAMEKPSHLRKFFNRVFLIFVLVILVRFVYIVTIRGETCDLGSFCFFNLPGNFTIIAATVGAPVSSGSISSVVSGDQHHPNLWTSKGYRSAVQFYSNVFGDLISEGFLSPVWKSLCVETPTGRDVLALREIGVPDAIGISVKEFKPLVVKGDAHRLPFRDSTFDFVFSGEGAIEKSSSPADFAAEIGRTLRPQGFAVIHTASKDFYSFNSLMDIFNCCIFIRSRDLDGFNSMRSIREIILKKEEIDFRDLGYEDSKFEHSNCIVPTYKQDIIQSAEPLILKEPLKPWITLKSNMKNIKYLPSMADISFKQRYIYIDVGSRSYGSSIVSWFKKQYPKQNKTFEIYAIEADKTFHHQYLGKKGVTLLPYAAWVRNETLFFEINGYPGDEKLLEKGRGMGRIRPIQNRNAISDNVDVINGFDFADWVKETVRGNDFVVMKMDVEGTEFDLIPKLLESGAMCLIDEVFLECHYNRWQKCCPGERSGKYEKTYKECLDLFTSLRKSGVLVHQWW